MILRIHVDKKKGKILAPPSSLTMGVKKVAGQNGVRTVKIKKIEITYLPGSLGTVLH